MRSDTPEDTTALLRAWTSGDHQVLEHLIPLVDKELRRVARRYLDRRRREEPNFQTTSLLNDAYVRLMRMPPGSLQGRAHFFAL